MAIEGGGIKKPKEVELDLDEVFRELELKMDRLKVLYEQYFMGMEKMPPAAARKDVERRMLDMSQMSLRNTAQRYRLNSLQQRFGSMRTYWNRVEREIENGTHMRTIAKVSREAIRKGQDIPAEVLRTMPEKMRQRVLAEVAKVSAKVNRVRPGTTRREPVAAPPPEEAGFDDMVDNLFDSITTKTPPVAMPSGGAATVNMSAVTPPPMPRAATPPPMPRPSPPPPPHAAAPKRTLPQGMTDHAVDELYRSYVAAKRQVGEDVRGITPEALAQSLAAQTPKILSDHKAKTIDYAVVVKDNRVVLKATPKK